jgi:hypothetical protein
MMARTATCSCGALSITTTGEPRRISACHCLACQKRTGSAFGVAVFFTEDQASPKGPSQTYARLGDSGSSLEFHFCPSCGSTVFWRPAFRPGLIAVAYGCFGEDAPAGPSQAVYGDHRRAWVTIATG